MGGRRACLVAQTKCISCRITFRCFSVASFVDRYREPSAPVRAVVTGSNLSPTNDAARSVDVFPLTLATLFFSLERSPLKSWTGGAWQARGNGQSFRVKAAQAALQLAHTQRCGMYRAGRIFLRFRGRAF